MTVTDSVAVAAATGEDNGSHAACSGPIDWLAAQYDRHGQLVYSLALHIVHDQTEAEEVVVETFLTLHRAQSRLGATTTKDHLLRTAETIALQRRMK